MAKKKIIESEPKVTLNDSSSSNLKPEEAVKLQTHCFRCGANLSLTGYVENNYKRFCGPACAA